MATIEYLSVIIEPWHYPDISWKKLCIKVVINGRTFYQQKIVQPDDLCSLFDVIFDEAKFLVGHEIRKEFEQAITDQQEQAQDH